MEWFASLVASFLSRIFKDWRRDGALKDLGAAEQANKAAAEAETRNRAGDAIDRRIEALPDADLWKEIRGDK